MNQDNNQKIGPAAAPKSYGEAKEEKDFLAREEIKTMGKDMSRLRETEADRERERVSRIKTAEEIARDKEREVLAQKASLERDLAEKEAKTREEKIKRMREEREAKENTSTQIETKKNEAFTGGFRDALRETQAREEEQRKKFLDRIAAKAEGGEVAPEWGGGPSAKSEIRPEERRPESSKREAPVPPPLPPAPAVIKEEKAPEVARFFLKKPSLGQKLWIRIILSLFVLSILALVATFWYWYLAVREEPKITVPINPAPEQKELVIPPPLFYFEDSRTLTLKISQTGEVPTLLSQALQGTTTLGAVSRILIEDAKNTEILGLKELFESLSITPPDNFYGKLGNNATLFVYSQEEGERIGLVVKIDNREGLAEMMTSWEGTMKESLKGLFELFGEDKPALVSYFRDAKYQETNFRFQTFSRQDLGIVYAIFDDYFILTTSWKSMEKTLDKLKETPLSIENMSLAEKIGQLFFIGINGTTLTGETERLIKDVRPGGILLLKKNIINEDQTRNLVRDLQQVSLQNYGIPLFIGVDQEGGEISPISFSQEKTAQSEIKTSEQAYAVGRSRGEELRDLGINLNLAPVLDTAQSGDFVFSRAFQATDSGASAFAKALISGQKTASILTAVKHFPGYGDIAFNPEKKLATLDETPQIGLFETAAEAKPEFVMTSNVIYSEIDKELPFSFSPKGIKLLKQSLGQDPLIMTDDLPQQSLIDEFSLRGIITLPIRAGADILTFSTNWETTLEAAVRILKEATLSGEITQGRIDDSVLKIIKLKKLYYE